MDIEKAPILTDEQMNEYLQKHKYARGSIGYVTITENIKTYQRDADHDHYVKVIEQAVKEITHELQQEVHVYQRLGKQRVDNFCKRILRRYGVEK